MPNPDGRAGAPMQEPTKDTLRERISTLEHALLVSEIRREQAEKRLAQIEDILGAAADKRALNADLAWAIIRGGISAAKSFSFTNWDGPGL